MHALIGRCLFRCERCQVKLVSFTHQATSRLSFQQPHSFRKMNRLLILALPLALALSANAQGGQACNSTSLCPASAPCCSACPATRVLYSISANILSGSFGFCGSDEFCLGGCNPLASNTLDSCRPNAICQPATVSYARAVPHNHMVHLPRPPQHTFTDNSRIFSNASFFDGNVSEYGMLMLLAKAIRI
jgi:hypothetical protein